MLRSSAKDKTCVPSASQLKDLLAALEDRCVQSRFPETVVYCRDMLIDLSSSPEGKPFGKAASACPDAISIERLCNSFTKVRNPSETGHVFLNLKAARAAP
jgi:hypothetical protein